VASASAVAVPGNRGRVPRPSDSRILLIAGGGGVDEKFAAVGCAAGGKRLGIDPLAAAVLCVALPAHEKTAIGAHRDGGRHLTVADKRVDLDRIGSERSAR